MKKGEKAGCGVCAGVVCDFGERDVVVPFVGFMVGE